mmetsp:Transcript_16335/g.41634  ORF Transcript_16335/g.41634 Transcript_16335/m.41634 type:complete len:126 (-) Transcript_16335:198-575(-)
MSIASAATYTVTQSAGGIVIGALINQAIPALADLEPIEQTIALVALQAVLNGGSVAAGMYLFNRTQNDPTGGLMFIWALIVTQPGLTDRMRLLASELGVHVRQYAPTAAASVLSSAATRYPAESC